LYHLDLHSFPTRRSSDLGLKWTFDVSFYRTMVFLIAASPCALAVTDIPATLSALSNLAKRGVLFKGGASLANLADLKAVVFDKTDRKSTRLNSSHVKISY